jgi:hypothetical protein
MPGFRSTNSRLGALAHAREESKRDATSMARKIKSAERRSNDFLGEIEKKFPTED